MNLDIFPLGDVEIAFLIGILFVITIIAPALIVALFPRTAFNPPKWAKPFISFALPMVEILVRRIFNEVDIIVTKRVKGTESPDDDYMWGNVRTKVNGWIDDIHTPASSD